MKNTAIAFEKIPEKTGIIALHFKSEKNNLPTIQLSDHTGKKHTIDLNRASFVLQHKAELVCQKLAKHQVAAMNCLHQFFEETIKQSPSSEIQRMQGLLSIGLKKGYKNQLKRTRNSTEL